MVAFDPGIHLQVPYVWLLGAKICLHYMTYQIGGPQAKPSTNRDVARVVTSGDTWKSAAVTIVAALKVELAYVTAKVIMENAMQQDQWAIIG